MSLIREVKYSSLEHLQTSIGLYVRRRCNLLEKSADDGLGGCVLPRVSLGGQIQKFFHFDVGDGVAEFARREASLLDCTGIALEGLHCRAVEVSELLAELGDEFVIDAEGIHHDEHLARAGRPRPYPDGGDGQLKRDVLRYWRWDAFQNNCHAPRGLEGKRIVQELKRLARC